MMNRHCHLHLMKKYNKMMTNWGFVIVFDHDTKTNQKMTS
jgi:hypothetical protein